MGAIEEQVRGELAERKLGHLLVSNDKFDPTQAERTGKITENNERR